MPVTITYDLSQVRDNNDRTYIRSALERFGWRRLGGSVFRYDGLPDADGNRTEDWLNHVVPSLMFFRAFILHRNLNLTTFTVDAHAVAMIDVSDPAAPFGAPPQVGAAIPMAVPTNAQSMEQALRDFVDGCTLAAP